jgi:hypothetical protein
MNPYAALGAGVGTSEAESLRVRLRAWHDAMVAHERRLRTGGTGDRCDEECPHVEARALWAEALATFGTRANDLAFLRSRAMPASESSQPIPAAAIRVAATDAVERETRAVPSPTARRPTSRIESSRQSQSVAAELQP